MLKMMIAILGLSVFATTAQARGDEMLERLECHGEVTRSGVLKLGVTSYLRERDGDLDRDYDVIRCHSRGMTRSGTYMFSCNHPYINSARISAGNRGLALFTVNYGNINRSIRGATHACAISGYMHEHDRSCDHGDTYPEQDVDQGDYEQGQEQGQEQGPEQGPEQGGKFPMK